MTVLKMFMAFATISQAADEFFNTNSTQYIYKKQRLPRKLKKLLKRGTHIVPKRKLPNLSFDRSVELSRIAKHKTKY